MREGVVIPFLPYLWVKLKLLMESNSGLYYAMRDQEYKVYQLMSSKEKTLAQKMLDKKRKERKERQHKSRGRRQ